VFDPTPTLDIAWSSEALRNDLQTAVSPSSRLLRWYRDVEVQGVSVIIIIFGLVFLYAGVNGLREARAHFNRGQQTDAVIVELGDTYTSNTDGPRKKAYYAIYAYRDDAGNEHRIRGGHTSTSKGSFPIGKRKTVYYNPDFPMEVRDTPLKEFSGLIFALVAGVAMVAFGVAAIALDWNL
jgi:hypothetical protein